VTVLLDGQGADELFGGYDVSGGWALRSLGIAAIAGGLLRGPMRMQRAKAVATESVPAALAQRYRRLLASPYASATATATAVSTEPPPVTGRSPMHRNLLREAFHTSLPGLLRFADRNSMAHSREVRMPFLDPRLAELAFSLPPDYLFRGGVTKCALRDAMRGIVPDVVLDRRDKGRFETPESHWFALPEFVDRASEVLLDRDAQETGLYNQHAIAADARAGQWRNAPALWRALNVELWRQMFRGEKRTIAEVTTV
jgi:asparagine synthase (glutamine-hydrolysing)